MADDQLQEQTKRALENESYSQIHSIRHLRSTLSRSLSASILAIESQRISLVQRQPRTVMTADLARARDTNDKEDTRSWELMRSYVGLKGLHEILTLGGGTNEASVILWRDVLAALEKHSTVEILQSSEVSDSSKDDDILTSRWVM